MESLLSNISDFSKKRFAEIPFPHRKDEFWRFGDLKSWGVDALFPFFQHHCQRKLKDAKIEGLEKSLHAKDSIVLFDGQMVFADLPKGAKVLSMPAAAEDYPERVKNFYDLADGKFDILQASRASAGAYIKIEDYADVELNIGVVSKLGVSTAGIILDIGRGASLKLNRCYLTFGGSLGAVHSGFFCGEGSRLESASIKFSEADSRSFEREDFDASDGVEIIDALAQAGASPSRQERNFEIRGSNSCVDTRAFVLSRGGITHDIRTRQMHRSGNSKSDLSVRAALFDASKLAFSGLIRVEECAQKTESYQSCRSLLMSEKALAQASPILEICANDVACSHGCTVSEPDPDELFYMFQRGLNPDSAMRLMVRSFAESSFEKLSDKENVGRIMSLIF